jgi:signal peptidase I
MKHFFESVWEIFKTILICLAIILPIRYYIAQPFYVKGASMEPNFHEHDYLLIDEISYRFSFPKRGDVIVFRYPQNPQEYFIKRVIGLPGETIEIKDGEVYVTSGGKSSAPLRESYIPELTETVSQISEPTTLKSDEYYVLGDNRNGSKDSRSFGPVKKDFIIGRNFFRGLPLSRVEFVKTPSYTNQ